MFLMFSAQTELHRRGTYRLSLQLNFWARGKGGFDNAETESDNLARDKENGVHKT